MSNSFLKDAVFKTILPAVAVYGLGRGIQYISPETFQGGIEALNDIVTTVVATKGVRALNREYNDSDHRIFGEDGIDSLAKGVEAGLIATNFADDFTDSRLKGIDTIRNLGSYVDAYKPFIFSGVTAARCGWDALKAAGRKVQEGYESLVDFYSED